jgi:catalase (peroxidase I)
LDIWKGKDSSLTYIPFDDTPGVFDNNVFKKTISGYCPLSFDCQVAEDPVLGVIAKLYADDQTAFFKQYAISFQKLTKLTNATLSDDTSVAVKLHANLLAEGSVANSTSSTPKSSALASFSWFDMLTTCMLLLI